MGFNLPKWCSTSRSRMRATSGNKWFSSCYMLTEIENISYLNTSEMTDMGDMFKNCSKLKSIIISKAFTTESTNLSDMLFNKCPYTPRWQIIWLVPTARTISMSFDDSETTGIREVNTSDSSNTLIYDLTGRRINKPQRGQIYIQNGKKRVANF